MTEPRPTADSAHPPSPAVPSLIARAARLHYEFSLTHQETAAALGVSRVKVTRLLKQAREAGIVRITVLSDLSPFAEVEERLARAVGLREAIVVPAPGGHGNSPRSMLARGTASYLERVMRDGLVVAVGLSRTVAEVPAWLGDPRLARASFVSLAGALPAGGHGSGNPYEATDALAAAFGGTAEHLHAPVIVQSDEAARVLRADPAISRTLERAVTADVALVGVGGRADRIDFQQGAQVTAAEWASLLAQGMVGDVGGRFFDRGGAEIEHELNRRVIGLSLEEFRKIPVRLVAAGGTSKTEALAAALEGGLITVLVTDVTTANTLIEGA
jgi:DNA-binding transcriptional regulator LsrR (DeoR family)